MKQPVSCFRPVEHWKSALMTLPDSNFFELMRSIFGNIKTPFNKQKLMDDLSVLLSREEIRQTIAGYIDKQDHKVIAAVALLREPSPAALEGFFSGELSYAELHGLLLNLEERLILYRLEDRDTRRLALNPVLEPVLAPFVSEGSILFPSSSAKNSGKGGKPGGIPDGRAMAALFAFISGEEGFFKNEGEIRKKVIDQGKRLFPGLDLGLAAGALGRLGLFRSEGTRFLPEAGRLRDFASLSSRERREYWAAGICLHRDGNGDFVFSRNRLRGTASFIHRFCGVLDPERRYPKTTLRRFMEILKQDDQGGGSAWGSRFLDSPQPAFESLLESLEKAGILEESGGFRRVIPFSGAEERDGKPVIAMDSAFSFILYPEISFTDALALSAFCAAKGELGTSFELSRSSAVRGFDSGLDSAYMLELLGRLSGGRTSENLEWTLRDWESRYSAVSLHQGLTLVLTEDRRYLAEAEPVASLIEKVLVPGVYLLSADDISEAAGALRKAGVDIIARPSVPGREDEKQGGRFSRAFPSLDGAVPALRFPSSPGAAKLQSSRSIKEHFLGRLKTMKLSKAERDELEARIERRLVLTESQLESASVKYEKLEARGLDYVGKAMIAKQAIAAGSLLELSWPGAGGGTNITTGIPSALEKKEGESVLILKPLPGKGEAEEIRLPLGKISLLRRIKQSIFGE